MCNMTRSRLLPMLNRRRAVDPAENGKSYRSNEVSFLFFVNTNCQSIRLDHRKHRVFNLNVVFIMSSESTLEI